MPETAASSVFEASPNELILKVAAELKKNASMNPPVWAPFVKTGTNRERIPEQPDWWFIRAAAVLRQIYIRPQGVQRLRRIYGGRKNMGFKPERFKKGSGNILRKILQQLEKAGYLKKEKSGRIVSVEGQRFLDSMAKSVPSVQVLDQQRTVVRVAEMAKADLAAQAARAQQQQQKPATGQQQKQNVPQSKPAAKQ